MPTWRSGQQSHGRDGKLRGLGVEERPNPHHRLLLGSPGRIVGRGGMVHGHREIPLRNGRTQGPGVDGCERTDATQVYALCG